MENNINHMKHNFFVKSPGQAGAAKKIQHAYQCHKKTLDATPINEYGCKTLIYFNHKRISDNKESIVNQISNELKQDILVTKSSNEQLMMRKYYMICNENDSIKNTVYSPPPTINDESGSSKQINGRDNRFIQFISVSNESLSGTDKAVLKKIYDLPYIIPNILVEKDVLIAKNAGDMDVFTKISKRTTFNNYKVMPAPILIDQFKGLCDNVAKMHKRNIDSVVKSIYPTIPCSVSALPLEMIWCF
jgi:hypothetical protein